MFKNWKTSLAGLLAGAAQLYAGGMTWKQILPAVLTAGVGLLAKDAGVTGGTIPATPEAENRVK